MARRSLPRISRDSILFIVGLAGIVYETIVHQGDQPTLLILFGGMVGLPAFLRADEARDKGGSSPPKAPEPGPVSAPSVPPADTSTEASPDA